MNNKTVSVKSIQVSIDYLEKDLIAKLDENINEVVNTYKNLQEKEILSSANIDKLVLEIRAKITKLQNDFTELATDIKKTMVQSTEDITIQNSNIEKTLM